MSPSPISRSRASAANVLCLFELTGDEAIALRRIAFRESDTRSLRRGDADRLLKLWLVAEAKDNLALTIAGKAQTDWLECLTVEKRLVLAYVKPSGGA